MDTPAVPAFIVMGPKHVLVPHRAHSFIVNVQPSFRTTAVSVLVEHVNRIVPADDGVAMMVKYPIEPVVCWLRRFPKNGCHVFWTGRATRDSEPWPAQRNKGEYLTWWDFKLRRELNRSAGFNYVICGCIVQEALEMENENRRKCFEEHLPARLD